MIGNTLTTTITGDLQQVPSIDHLVDLLHIQDPEFIFVDNLVEEDYSVPTPPTNPKNYYNYYYAKH
jgi:ssDNA-specific exonuclease RecJ